ncbi:DUF1365 domain-containing protein [Kaistia dalseonensis]|uniref:DUF1365 family protein n=1 Tax=Kaistia dalseonensis TaxID=410840 RepID=A0ABU0H7K2_9HYPH|nr:DUF1365 domain-containing protein [Kaistia dalseonensis]MCX5495694.1 DUF1365 domain-containing protein [Kaistia dalseonensis]MDQ0438290.1 DUF1365 family protein [Kaistia dalseonensis]
MSTASALYSGSVIHRRMRPRPHKLRYRVFWTVLDLDEIAALDASLRLFAHNRFGLISFHDRDHGAGTDEPLRAQVERQLERAGIDIEGGPIRILCMPRMLGYVFNPISVYFCHHRSGALSAMLYEVTNTFGQRHSYLIPVDPDQASPGASIRQSCRKALYVSPFIDMDITYDFRVTAPTDRVALAITGSDAEGILIATAMTARRSELTDGAIIRATLTHPLLTLKVIGGIHWEALKLWLKGVKLTKRPAAPDWPVTIVDRKAV